MSGFSNGDGMFQQYSSVGRTGDQQDRGAQQVFIIEQQRQFPGSAHCPPTLALGDNRAVRIRSLSPEVQDQSGTIPEHDRETQTLPFCRDYLWLAGWASGARSDRQRRQKAFLEGQPTVGVLQPLDEAADSRSQYHGQRWVPKPPRLPIAMLCPGSGRAQRPHRDAVRCFGKSSLGRPPGISSQPWSVTTRMEPHPAESSARTRCFTSPSSSGTRQASFFPSACPWRSNAPTSVQAQPVGLPVWAAERNSTPTDLRSSLKRSGESGFRSSPRPGKWRFTVGAMAIEPSCQLLPGRFCSRRYRRQGRPFVTEFHGKALLIQFGGKAPSQVEP